MENIFIIFRDIHGRVQREHFGTSCGAIAFCQTKLSEENEDEDEILLVSVFGVCAYSALSNRYAISWEDLIGFLA